MKKALLATLLVSGTIFASGPVRAETLMGALAKAYNNNSQLNSDRAAVRASDEDIVIAKSGYRPTVMAFASYTRGRSAAAPYNTIGSVGIQVEQKLFDGFVTKNNVAAAETQAQSQRYFLRNSEQNQLFNAVQAYTDVFAARKIAALRREDLAALEEQVRADRARLEVGEGTRTDLAQSEAQRSQAISQLHQAVADVKSKEAVYRQVIGDDPAELQKPASAKALPGNIKDGFLAAALEHPAILQSKFAVDAAAHSVKAKEGALLPQVDFTVSTSYNEIYNGPGISGRSDSIGISLNIPFYEGGRRSAQIRQSKEQLGQAQIQVDLYQDQVRKELADAWSQLEGARASAIAYKDSVSANQIALEGRIQENRVGQATTLDVLTSRGLLIDSQINLVWAERDVVVASYSVAVAMGQMNAERLGLQVSKYDAEEHYRSVRNKWIGLRLPDGR